MVEEIQIQIPGRNLAARAWGPADAPPVLALHGWQDNAASFDLLAPHLPGLRIVAVDLAGHGLSDHLPPGASYTFLDWVTDIRAAVHGLGWSRFAFLGHSLGAGIANAFAAAWPDLISRVAAIDGFAPRYDAAHNGPERLAEHFALRARFAGSKPRTFPDQSAAAARLMQQIRGLTEEGARALITRGVRELPDGGVTWRRDRRIQAGPPIRLDREQILGFLRGVKCPVLLVRPTDGWKVSDAAFRVVTDSIAKLCVERIEGGHHVHLEKPEEVAGMVLRFLAG